MNLKRDKMIHTSSEKLMLFTVFLMMIDCYSCKKGDFENRFQTRQPSGTSVLNKAGMDSLKIERFCARFVGRELTSIPPTLLSSVDDRYLNYVLMLFRPTDCPSCLFEGFKFAKQIQGEAMVYFVTDSTTSPQDYELYGIRDERLLFDLNSKLHKELEYFFTPVFIHVDADSKIKGLYFPSRGGMAEFKRQFLSNLK